MGAEVDPYPSRHHPPHSALQCPGKNRPDFLKTSYLFTARLQSPLVSLPLCCIDFLLTKNVSFLLQLWQQSQGWGIYLLHLYTVLEEQFSPPSTSIYLPDTQSEVTGNSTYSTSTHQSLEKCSISEHASDGRSKCFSLLGCQRQPCEQRARGLKTDSLVTEDFTMPGFLNFSHPLWFPPFRIPIYPEPWRKKEVGGCGEVLDET